MPDIPLAPKNGYDPIAFDSLQRADIIVSTTSRTGSTVIRGVTGSEVSHAMLYIGNWQVIESIIPDGVVVRSINEALSDARLAVALRYRNLSLAKRDQIVDFANSKIGSEYDYVGAASSGLQAETPITCYGVACFIRPSYFIKPNFPDKYFCSELILEAFNYAGCPFTQMDDGPPQDIVTAYENGKLDYVGHLLG